MGVSSAAVITVVLLIGGAALCQSLLFAGSCHGRCDAGLDHSADCQCNSNCHHYGDCCSDYATLCTDTGSCAGHCNSGYQPSRSCQCNSQCSSHGNCCHDYGSLCQGHQELTQSQGNVTCQASVNDVSEALWSNDVNRLDPSTYTLNFKSKVSSGNTADHSSAPFFTHVDASVLTSRPTFSTFLALQDNYNPVGGQHDVTSASENNEVDNFLDAVLATSVMDTLLNYLRCRNIVTDKAHLRSTLKQLWFSPYSRHHGGAVDSSGFEHVMVGEFKSSTVVNGLHNWLAFYNKERSHQINYYGYIRQEAPGLVAVNYGWDGRVKALGGFFVGTSPEFDMALFTLCALTSTGSVHLQGHMVHVQIYKFTHSNGGTPQIASAYPDV